MPEATAEELRRLVDVGPFDAYRLTGPRDTADARYLGVVGISLVNPMFRSMAGFPFNGTFSPESRFELRDVQHPVHGHLVFVVFRQFERSRFQAFPEDLVAGWVPGAEADQARRWIHELNNRIRAYQAGGVRRHFALNSRFPGTREELAARLESVLGCGFRPVNRVGYDVLPGLEALHDGLRLWFFEREPTGPYPRRHTLTGNPDRDDLPSYERDEDLGGQMVERLRATGADWYVASPEEHRADVSGDDDV